MSYHITYNPDLRKKYSTSKKNKTKPLKIALLLLVGFVAVYIFTQSGFARYLIPGDPEITTEAFSEMVKHVRQGESVGNAIVVFCREIIQSS